jgi:hypothetical protein
MATAMSVTETDTAVSLRDSSSSRAVPFTSDDSDLVGKIRGLSHGVRVVMVREE